MTKVGARRHGDDRGFWRVGWVPIVNGAEIMGVKFATQAEAIAYAKRVADYENETLRDYKTEGGK